MTLNRSYEVRYGTFACKVEKRQWVPCRHATIDGDTLRIDYVDGMTEWVPLHVIRGPIQLRTCPTPETLPTHVIYEAA